MNIERYHYHLVKTSTAGRYSKRKTDFVKTISIKCVHTRRTQNIVAPSYQLLHNNIIIILVYGLTRSLMVHEGDMLFEKPEGKP